MRDLKDIQSIITVADILDMPNGQSLYDQLDEMIPYFSSIKFLPGFFIVTVAKGNDLKELSFTDLDLNHKQQFTYDVDGSGATSRYHSTMLII